MKNRTKRLLVLLTVLMAFVFSIGLLACPKDPVLTSIEVSVLPNTLYKRGESLNLAGGKIALYYDNDTFTEIDILDANNKYTDGIKVSGYDSNVLGDQPVTITYNGQSTTLNVNVSEAEVSGITINTLPKVTNYFVGEKLTDLENGSISILYKTGARSTLAMTDARVTASAPAAKAGDCEITVTYTLSSSEKYETSFYVDVFAADTISIVTQPKIAYTSDDNGFEPANGKIKLTTSAADGSISKEIAITNDFVTGFNLIPTQIYDSTTDELLTSSTKSANITCGGKTIAFTYTLQHTDLGYVRYSIYSATNRNDLDFSQGIPSRFYSVYPRGSNNYNSLSMYCMEALEIYSRLSDTLKAKVSGEVDSIILVSADYVEYTYAFERANFAAFFFNSGDDEFAQLYPHGSYNSTDAGGVPWIEIWLEQYVVMQDYEAWVKEYLDPYYSMRISSIKTINDVIDPIISLMGLKGELFEQSKKEIEVALAAYKTMGSNLVTLTTDDLYEAFNIVKQNMTWTQFMLLDQLHDINYGGINAHASTPLTGKNTFINRLYDTFYSLNDYASIGEIINIGIFPGNLSDIYSNLQNALQYQYYAELTSEGELIQDYPSVYIDTMYSDYYVRLADQEIKKMIASGDKMMLDIFYNLEFSEGDQRVTMYDYYSSVKYNATYSQINLFGASYEDPGFNEFVLEYIGTLWDRSDALSTLLNTLVNSLMNEGLSQEQATQEALRLAEPQIAVQFSTRVENVLKMFLELPQNQQIDFIVGSDIVQWNVFNHKNSDIDAQRFSFFEGNDLSYGWFINLVKNHYISTSISGEDQPSFAGLNQDQQRTFKYMFLSLEEYLWMTHTSDDSNDNTFKITMFNAIRYYNLLTPAEQAALNTATGFAQTYNMLLGIYNHIKEGNWQPVIDTQMQAKLAKLDGFLTNLDNYIKNVSSEAYPQAHYYAGYLASVRLWEEILADADADLTYYLLNSPTAYNGVMSYSGKLHQLNTAYNKHITTMKNLLYRAYSVQAQYTDNTKTLFADYYESFVIGETSGEIDGAVMLKLYADFQSLNKEERLFFVFIDAFGGGSFQSTLNSCFTQQSKDNVAIEVARYIYFTETMYAFEQMELDPKTIGHTADFTSEMAAVIIRVNNLTEKGLTELKNLMRNEGEEYGEIYATYLRLLDIYNAM